MNLFKLYIVNKDTHTHVFNYRYRAIFHYSSLDHLAEQPIHYSTSYLEMHEPAKRNKV